MTSNYIYSCINLIILNLYINLNIISTINE
uniref:Uncharacterized protein n=1 Tax=viral metagenome TaxID=1070528 RepID=A0A6C0ET51_9ZZZZ